MNIDGLLRMPSVMLFLTLAVYALAVQIRARTGNVLCNPVLISTLVLMGYLRYLPSITSCTILLRTLLIFG